PALGALTFRWERGRESRAPGRSESNRPKGAVPMPLSILLAVADAGSSSRGELAEQLAADGHEVHQAHHSRHAVALLAGRQLDVLILGALEHPTAALALLRELRAGALDVRAWPELPTITLAPLLGVDELDALRAYEAGSDHHLPIGAGYLHLRA